LTTKIHVVVDALGNPLALSLTGGQTHDITQAETLVANLAPDAVLADKGYDSDGFITSLERRGIEAVIPPKANRKIKRDCDYALYAERNLIERFFQYIKQFRGIATRYEKPPATFSRAFIWSALWLGLNEDTP
jgi:transposase